MFEDAAIILELWGNKPKDESYQIKDGRTEERSWVLGDTLDFQNLSGMSCLEGTKSIINAFMV